MHFSLFFLFSYNRKNKMYTLILDSSRVCDYAKMMVIYKWLKCVDCLLYSEIQDRFYSH